MLKYEVHHYDDLLNLKISPFLWFIILYGVRHIFFSAAAILMPDDISASSWLSAQANSMFMLTDIPAALVLLATGHRIPEASLIMRIIWARGRALLVASYVLSICLFIYLSKLKGVMQMHDENNLIFFASVILPDILAIYFTLKSELIKDIFSEFPAPIKNS
jgi:hypothetical protein